MNLAPFHNLLSERAGLDATSLGNGTVQAAVAQRLRVLGMEERAYARLVASDAVEFARLLDEVVVPETWFFRGGNLFAHLADLVRAVTLALPGIPFRVLSLPCSTGEEPWSLAIALTEAGVPPSRWSILGVDLSPANVEAAHRGRFSELSFRQTPADLRSRYFVPRGTEWEIAGSLRTLVRFQVGNLLDPGSLLLEKPFDLVFCRNLFIYLTRVARQMGRTALARLVAPGGLLCVGHAEPLPAEETRFVREGPEGYFLYRRARIPAPQVLAAKEERPATPLHPQTVPQSRGIDRDRAGTLARARLLADQGDLDAALALCLEAQQGHGPTADLYTLLGIVHQARRDSEQASLCFTRALYLDPRHREALVHLMWLHQLAGAPDRAAALRRRLERLPPVTEETAS